MRHYIANSSIFDYIEYDESRIVAALRRADATNIRRAFAFGWRNQPHVVTFNGDPTLAVREVSRELGTQWIIARRKDWK
jgi:hypothetical protein